MHLTRKETQCQKGVTLSHPVDRAIECISTSAQQQDVISRQFLLPRTQ